MSSSTKRHSMMPRAGQLPKAPVNLSSSVVIHDNAVLTGNHTINISSETVIHPRNKLDSSHGRVTIGRRCIIHERVVIGAPSADPTKGEFGVTLEDYVTVEVAAVIESGCTTIGEGCLIGVGARIGRGAKLGKHCQHCTITARSVIQPGEQLPDYTVLYSNGTRRTDKRGVTDLKNKAQARQIDVMRRLIPTNLNRFKE
ncbi:trimeric LpxA-like protein [Apiospora rasikravindrae]|uniref:Dynactin subunit 6 n=1 Tax=Apiospora rasikravindrae TaxID=990691 RepID=A0ABR1TF61_9PEZI